MRTNLHRVTTQKTEIFTCHVAQTGEYVDHIATRISLTAAVDAAVLHVQVMYTGCIPQCEFCSAVRRHRFKVTRSSARRGP